MEIDRGLELLDVWKPRAVFLPHWIGALRAPDERRDFPY